LSCPRGNLHLPTSYTAPNECLGVPRLPQCGPLPTERRRHAVRCISALELEAIGGKQPLIGGGWLQGKRLDEAGNRHCPGTFATNARPLHPGPTALWPHVTRGPTSSIARNALSTLRTQWLSTQSCAAFCGAKAVDTPRRIGEGPAGLGVVSALLRPRAPKQAKPGLAGPNMSESSGPTERVANGARALRDLVGSSCVGRTPFRCNPCTT
jgi:hypothetical protein